MSEVMTRVAQPLDAETAATPRFASAPIAALAGIQLAAHLLTIFATPYGIHRDEFLYLAMGRYLDFWRMDFPPAIAVLANIARALGGDTLFAIRLFPALAGTALIVLAALLAREFGGGRAAQMLAAFTVLLSPVFLRAASLFQPVVFDQLWWTLGWFALARAGRADEPRWWLLLGVATGFGLLTKFTIAFFGVGVLVGLAASPQRRALATRWPYTAAAIALIIGSASITGQVLLGFPVAGQMADLQASQLVRVTPGAFISGQLLLVGPASALLALGGIVWLVRSAASRPYRAVGWSCVAAVVALLLLRGKAYYAAPVYPALFAAAAVWLTTSLRSRPRARRALVAAAVALIAIGNLPAVPFGLPIVPPEPMARYAAVLGITRAVTTNRGEQLPLPQDYADMLGWEERVEAVARAYHALPEHERVQAVVIASNYGQAGAIDFFGPRYGLPRAVSPVGSYWFFGPGPLPGDVAVIIGVEPHELAEFYRAVELVGRADHPWAVPEERDAPILVARSPIRTLQQVWPELAGRN